MNLRKVFFLALALFCTTVQAQFPDPVSAKVSTKRVAQDMMDVVFQLNIEPGWHVYSTGMTNGPTSAIVKFDTGKDEGVKLAGGLKHTGNEIKVNDPMFEMMVRYFEGNVTFTQRIHLTAKHYKAKGYLEYGVCNETNCLPPASLDFSIEGDDGPDVSNTSKKNDSIATQTTIADTLQQADNVAISTAAKDSLPSDSLAASALANMDGELWASCVDELRALDNDNTDHGLLVVFALGFLGGLLALLTPCVWPIIPMTVSFFLHRSGEKKKAVREAVIYGASIVVIYLVLGIAVTLIKGPNALNDLSTNAVFNIFFALLLVVFAASFLGGFELTLPSSWSNKVNEKADATSGLASLFLMAFTLVLVSFSCTGPIIGFLLVEVSTYSGLMTPIVGMFAFALALALPFTLFALFPMLLKKVPKSGGWMNTIKVVLAFIELAFALKFLSVADLAYGWRLLDREVFLCLWIVLFALLGIYLLGGIRFPGDDEQKHTSVPRFLLALLPLAFAVYLVPGLWGAPLKAVSAFAPPIYTQDFRLGESPTAEPKFRTYEEGMLYAQKEGKPVLLDFTGFGCVNCRKMEMAVWSDPQVRNLLENDYVLISLYVDDKTPLPEPVEIVENGTKRTLRTVGDKWSYLQRTKFGASAQPFYVAVSPDGHPLAPSRSYNENVSAYVDFLRSGLEPDAQ